MSSQAAYVIRNLASADENQAKFVEHGVLPPLHALILSQQSSSIIASLAALRNLSIHPKNEIAIMEGGFPDLLSDIIKDSKLPDILNHAIGTIRYCLMLRHFYIICRFFTLNYSDDFLTTSNSSAYKYFASDYYK